MLNYDQVCRPFWYHSAIQPCPMPYKCPSGSVTGNVRYYDVFVVKHPVFQDDKMVDILLLCEFIRGLLKGWAYPKVSLGEHTFVVRRFFVVRIGFVLKYHVNCEIDVLATCGFESIMRCFLCFSVVWYNLIQIQVCKGLLLNIPC